MWYTTPEAQTLLDSLTPADLRIVDINDIGGRQFVWGASTYHGAMVLADLSAIREAAIAAHPLDAVWQDATYSESARNAALTDLINAVPFVSAALASRFGSANAWYSPASAHTATIVWRASFAPQSELAA